MFPILLLCVQLVSAQIVSGITSSGLLEPTSVFQSIQSTTLTSTAELANTPSTSTSSKELLSSEFTVTLSSSVESLLDTSSTSTTFDQSSTTESSVPTTTPDSNATVTTNDDESPITAIGNVPAENSILPDALDSGLTPAELTPEESVNATALDLDMYANLLVNAPLTPGEDNDAAPVMLPACPVSLKDGTAKRSWFSLPKPPPKPDLRSCMPTNLNIEVIYRYVPNGDISSEEKTALRQRVKKQHDFFQSVVTEFGIDLAWSGSLVFQTATVGSAKFTEHFKTNIKTNDQYRKNTRRGASDVLNVWLVNSIIGEDNQIVSGYSQFPEERKFTTDGIVLAIPWLTSNNEKTAAAHSWFRGSVLVHEFGHWMGLIHVFGDSNCGRDDGIADTYQFSNQKSTLHECNQPVCGKNKLGSIWVKNWMSYSNCMGSREKAKEKVDFRSFTQGQQAVMFSRFLAFRRNLNHNSNFCASGKIRRDLPSHQYHELKRRAEDKAKILADLLLSNCSVAIQDVFQEDSIPLPSSALASYSSAAVSMIANPTTVADDVALAPKTASVGSAITTAGEPTSNIPTSTAGGAASTSTKPSKGIRIETSHLSWVFVTVVSLSMLAW